MRTVLEVAAREDTFEKGTREMTVRSEGPKATTATTGRGQLLADNRGRCSEVRMRITLEPTGAVNLGSFQRRIIGAWNTGVAPLLARCLSFLTVPLAAPQMLPTC